MPDPDKLPVLFLPRHLSAAQAAHFIDALQQLIAAMERHYSAQMRRRSQGRDIGQRDLDSAAAPIEPPF